MMTKHLAVSGCALLLAGAPALADTDRVSREIWEDAHMWGTGMGFGFMGLTWIIVIVVVVLAVRWMSDQPRGGAGGGSTSPAPLDTLKDRFARGEIDEAEYTERKRVLER